MMRIPKVIVSKGFEGQMTLNHTFGRFRPNTLEAATVKQVLKSLRKSYRVTQKASKFLNDLNAEIEMGWTGSGQTNRLLGRITLRAYVFGHVLLNQKEPLTGKLLIDRIVSVAEELPGYREYCNHQHELLQRVEAWTRCIEGSHYFPYGSTKGLQPQAPQPSGRKQWNEQQQAAARDRISQSVARYLEQGYWPTATTARFKLLVADGMSGQTLYKHKDLWHPAYLAAENANLQELAASDCLLGAPEAATLTSLLECDACNDLSDGDSSASEAAKQQEQAVRAREHIRQEREAYRQAHVARQLELFHERDQRYWAQIMQHLSSDDPILRADAESRLYGDGQGRRGS